MIDQEIGEFFYENEGISDDELNSKFDEKNYINRCLNLLSKLSSKNVIELLKRSNYLNDFIDLKKYIKKYPINKTFLRKNKDMYIEEYHKLRNMCLYLSDISENYKVFNDYMSVLDVDNVEAYLLSNMPNEQIYSLSCETTDWMQKLYYFSFIKKEN